MITQQKLTQKNIVAFKTIIYKFTRAFYTTYPGNIPISKKIGKIYLIYPFKFTTLLPWYEFVECCGVLLIEVHHIAKEHAHKCLLLEIFLSNVCSALARACYVITVIWCLLQNADICTALSTAQRCIELPCRHCRFK